MKHIITAILLMVTIATASEQTEIKAYLSSNGITATQGSAGRAVELLNAKPSTSTTTTNYVARDATKLAQELQVQSMVDLVLATNVPLPYTKSVTTQVMGTLNYMLDASTDLAGLKTVTKLQGNLLALKAELGGDLTYTDFAKTSNTVTTVTVTYGDSYATTQAWTGYLHSKNKANYIKGLYR